MTQFYTDLRATLADGLDRLEAAGAPPGDAVADLFKAAVAISLAANGPDVTILGLRRLIRQIEGEFPEEAETARRALAMERAPAGRA
jgi:hypothetical protein